MLQKAAEILGLDPEVEVSLLLCDDIYIRELNREYRSKDLATDVLSFALEEGEEPAVIGGPKETLLGDIVISVETATRQAKEYGHSLEREVAFLAIHGLLHLLGYDHELGKVEEDAMRLEEEKILVAAGLGR